MLGGVSKRFPTLNFGFLEGGVAWAADLYAGLVGWLTLNESIGWHHAVGAAMILPGIYLASQAPPVAVVKNEN